MMMPNPSQHIDIKPTTYSLVMLLSLYLAQGLPVGFMTQALPALLRNYGVSLTQIGVSGLLMLPWAIKFLWAPIVDRRPLFAIGHYRSWIIFTQVATIMCLLLLAFLPIERLQYTSTLWGMFLVLFTMNMFCATQDIATDGLAVNILRQGKVHWGNTFQVMGSRLGFLLGGGAVLYSIDVLSWSTTFFLLVFGVLLNSILILYYREPSFKPVAQALENTQKLTFWQQFGQLYGYLYSNRELTLWLWVILSYKVADGLSGPIIKPMMIDMGLSLTQIGVYVTMFGAGCALAGALLAGWLIQRSRLSVMLLLFSLGQSLSLIYYVVLAYLFNHQMAFSHMHLYIANAIEEFFAAMGLVAILSIIMRYARTQYAATDFTVQVAVMTMVSGVLYLLGGKLADELGYYHFLLLVFIISLLTFIPKIRWYKGHTHAQTKYL